MVFTHTLQQKNIQKLSIILFIILIIGLMFPPMSFSLHPDHKRIPYELVIENIEDFKGYVFLLYKYNEPENSIIITPNEGGNIGEISHVFPTLYAVKLREFNKSELNQDFFYNPSPKLYHSDKALPGSAGIQYAWRDNPLDKRTVYIRILNIDDINKSIEIEYSKIKYIYSDGSYEIKEVKDQNNIPTPKTSTRQKLLSFTNIVHEFSKYVITILYLISTIGALFYFKKWRKCILKYFIVSFIILELIVLVALLEDLFSFGIGSYIDAISDLDGHIPLVLVALFLSLIISLFKFYRDIFMDMKKFWKSRVRKSVFIVIFTLLEVSMFFYSLNFGVEGSPFPDFEFFILSIGTIINIFVSFILSFLYEHQLRYKLKRN